MIIRVGLNSGSAIAALIERSRFIYDAWGETVNLASRIGAVATPGAPCSVTEQGAPEIGKFSLDYQPPNRGQSCSGPPPAGSR